jgi:outer membrane protein assembly factor BamB
MKYDQKKLLIVAMLLLLGFYSIYSQDENWTHFRGSSLNGIATVENAPVSWDEETNVKWKTAIHGKGWSSPVVFENQVWLTTAAEDGKELFALCLDFITGEIVFDIKVFSIDSAISINSINTYATPTPAIENGFVYVNYGSMGTACINTTNGSVVWTRTDLKCDHVHGPGSSVFLYKDFLILHYEGVDVRFIASLDKHSGKTIWISHRQDEPYEELPMIEKKAFVTPLLINLNGRDLIISNGSAIINAFDPYSGEEVWGIKRGVVSTVPMPIEENGIVYFKLGGMIGEDRSRFSELVAVNPDGSGDITNTNILWTFRVAYIPVSTPVIKDGLIYTADSDRTIRCIDASNGKEVWYYKSKSLFNSSPVYADGNVYFSSTGGETLVIRAGRELNIIRENKLNGEIWATPAILRNNILMRTDGFLYRIGE